jgi:hypothetical protein
MANLKQAASQAIKTHGSLRKAADKLNIHYTLLSMLASGKRTSASPETLEKLGLRARRVISRLCVETGESP